MCGGKGLRCSQQHLAAILHFKNCTIDRWFVFEEYDYMESTMPDNPRIAITAAPD